MKRVKVAFVCSIFKELVEKFYVERFTVCLINN